MSGLVRYDVDGGVSRFTVRAFATGMLSALAHNPTFAVRDYRGEVQFDPETADQASLMLTITATSLELTDDLSSKDRREIERVMQQDVLESGQYPTINYECPPAAATVTKTGDGQFDVALNGNLTLHGVTRRQPIAARVIASPATVRAYGEFSPRQSDYGIKLVTVAGSMLKVKDELKCTFDIVARPAV